jgi:subtilisin family serine protease
MTEEAIQQSPSSEPQNRSQTALVFFLLFTLPLPLCLFMYHFMVWSFEQSAIISLSAKGFEWAGLIGLLIQTLVLSSITGIMLWLTTDSRFKTWFRKFFIASLVGLPTLSLRFLGANNDQLGFILQFLIAISIFAILYYRNKNNFNWQTEKIPFALLISAIGISPLVLYGSLGSFGDTLLSLLAGLSIGLLASTLITNPAENIWLNGFGVAAILSMLASVFGYDGSQLILIVLLPAFSFGVAALLPSRSAISVAVGIITFAGLTFFDPTELTIVLGDIAGIASTAVGLALLIGWGTSLVALIMRQVTETSSPSRMKRLISWSSAGLGWVILIVLYFVFGNTGNYGDRLFVILKNQADISDVANISNREQRLTETYQRLTEHANTTQADLRNIFDGVGVKYTPYYLQNAMEVQGSTLIRLFLAFHPDVERVIPSPRLRAVPDDSPAPGFVTDVDGSVQWNIEMIGADKVWEEFGVQGEGIVVGQSDSGVDGEHPAIQKQYRGYNGSDDYNWFDPWDGTSSPNDEGGHGTHTMGTILGNNGIGVAPQTQWIGCVNLDRNLANPALYLDCMQFMLAPFPIGGNPLADGDPTQAAHVMNNSWGCPEVEGCDPNALLVATENLRYAGIFVVVSTGNDGPSCETVASPLSLYDSVFSVGAIDEFGNMAPFSSRGPVTVDGSGRIKPDIVAPGVEIMSALPEGTYGANSGTSMAGPHLVGVVALIWSAQPELIGDIDATEQLIIDTAQPYTGSTTDGCFTGNNPSNAYGYGVVDVYEAVKQALGK